VKFLNDALSCSLRLLSLSEVYRPGRSISTSFRLWRSMVYSRVGKLVQLWSRHKPIEGLPNWIQVLFTQNVNRAAKNKVTLLLSVKDNYHHCRQQPQRMRTQRKQRSEPEATSITTALCNQRNTSGRLINHLTTSLLQKTKTPANAKPAVCTVRTNPVKNQLSHKMIHSNWNTANPKLFHI